MSGRQIGLQLGMSKANVYKWAKKMSGVWINPETDFSGFQMDELWHFISKRPRTDT
jgi:hypothetical protein